MQLRPCLHHSLHCTYEHLGTLWEKHTTLAHKLTDSLTHSLTHLGINIHTTKHSLSLTWSLDAVMTRSRTSDWNVTGISASISPWRALTILSRTRHPAVASSLTAERERKREGERSVCVCVWERDKTEKVEAMKSKITVKIQVERNRID